MHEAGFDSYITGSCFIALSYLSMKPSNLKKNKEGVFETFLNKIHS